MTYKLNPNADINGTHKQGELQTTFGQLLAVFGMPEESDGHKSSGDWIFESKAGDVFTIYDWKSTSLYDSSLPSVDEFRRSPAIVTFSVGGRGNASDFLMWVSWRLNEITPEEVRRATLEYLDGLTTSDAQSVLDAEYLGEAHEPNLRRTEWRTLGV